MSKKFLITEEEKKHILGLYGLLKETEGDTSLEDLKLDKTINFGPGYYMPSFSYKSINTGDYYEWDIKDLDPGLNKIKEFLKNNPTGYIVDVQLKAGESKIPNNDVKKDRLRVDPGYLNTARLNTLKTYLNETFETWKFEGINTNFKINEETTIGPTEWVGTPFCPAGSDTETQRATCYKNYINQLKLGNQEVKDLKAKYDAEQYFQVIITVNKADTAVGLETKDVSKCAVEIEIVVSIDQHNCQNAEFFIFANNTLLYNEQGGMTANLNTGTDGRGIPTASSVPIFEPEVLNPGYGYLKNGYRWVSSYGYGVKNEKGDNDGTRMDVFIIPKEKSLELMQQANGIIDIWMIATTTTAHKDKPKVRISLGQNVVYNDRPKIVQGKLLTLDGCSGEVIVNSDSTIPDVTGYVDILRQEKTQIQNQIENEKLLSGGSEKRKEKKKIKIDLKSIVLERVSGMVTEMTNFLNYLNDGLESTVPLDEYGEVNTEVKNIGNPEIRAEVERYYKIFYDNINFTGTTEDPQPSFAKNTEGEYIDDTIRKDDLYGDIRDYLTAFYEGFDAVYLGNDGYEPKGVQFDRKLNGTLILKRIKRLDNYTL